jgi:endonuclease-8
MPEGDTIYRAACSLNKVLAGKTVTVFETGYAKLASINDDTPLTGRTITKVESRGKWLLIYFSGNLILTTHMLMSGSWHIYRTGEKWWNSRRRMVIRIAVDGWEVVAFNVPIAEFHTAASLARSQSIPRLGPDLLASDYTIQTGTEQLRRHAQRNPEDEIANALLNQRVLAGLGNVYKSEVCFAARVHPFRRMNTLSIDEMQKISDIAQRYLQANVIDGSEGGIVTYTGRRRTTKNVDGDARLWVYGRRGQECRRCGAIIEMRRQGSGARSTYWCPSCQL